MMSRSVGLGFFFSVLFCFSNHRCMVYRFFPFGCFFHTTMPTFTALGQDKTSRRAAFWSLRTWESSHIPNSGKRDTDFLAQRDEN